MPHTYFFIAFAVGILSAIIPILIYLFTRIKDLEEKLNTHIYGDNTIDEFDDDLTLSEDIIDKIYEEINVIQDFILINEKLKVVDENKLQEQIKSLQEQINKYKNDNISS